AQDANGCDALAGDADVGAEPLQTRAIDDPAAGDEQIEHEELTTETQRAQRRQYREKRRSVQFSRAPPVISVFFFSMPSVSLWLTHHARSQIHLRLAAACSDGRYRARHAGAATTGFAHQAQGRTVC